MKKLIVLLFTLCSLSFSQGNMRSSLIPAWTDSLDIGSQTKLIRDGWFSELQALLFAKNTITVHGGWDLIAKDAGTLQTDVGTGTTQINFGTTMAVNDFIVCRNVGQVEYMQIVSLVSGTTYNVTRNLDGSGANAWAKGTPWANLGYNGTGRIELQAGSGAGETRVSVIKQGTLYNSQTEIMRFGDLDGFLGYSGTTWGFAVGSATHYIKYDATTNTLSVSDYIQIGGAASDVNAGATKISGGLIELSSATTGALAGMTIAADRLTATSGGNTTLVSTGDTVFASGATGAPTFWVSKSGYLTATSGKIGGATITGDTLKGGSYKTNGGVLQSVTDQEFAIEANTTYSDGAAVYAIVSGTDAKAVYGSATGSNGVGVYGYGVNGSIGIIGASTTNYGIKSGVGGMYAEDSLRVAGVINASGIISALGGSSTNWNTSYGWGNHASAGYLTAETDPNVYAWAKAATKPSYTYSEVGALASGGTAANSSLLESHNAAYFAVAFTGMAASVQYQDWTGGLHTLVFTNGVLTNQIDE